MSEKVAIVGSRDYPDLAQVRAYVASLPADTIIVSGGARGVDTAAEEAARAQHLQVVIFPAEKGKSPLLRNHDIVAAADRVVAFWDGTSTGTMHTVGLARKAGKPAEIRRPESALPRASIRTISLTQPWASLVMLGAKKIETRSWPAPKAMIGQRIAIHASKGFPPDARDACLDPFFFRALWPDMVSRGEDDRPLGRYIALPTEAGGWRHYAVGEIERLTGTLPRGMVLCTARLTGCWSTDRLALIDRLPDAERAFGFYGPDRWMWGLEAVEVLPEPIPARGQLGLWRWE